MNLAGIREQIQSILAGVSGIGVVHGYDRWSNEWSRILDLYKDETGRINGCAFARERWQEQQETMGESETAHVFLVRRIMGLKDDQETGILFDDHLEEMRAAFRDNKTLNGTCRTIDPDWGPMSGAVGLQGDVIETRTFAGVLCHYAELRLCVIAAEEN